MRCVLYLLLFATLPLQAQNDPAIFRATTQLVIETVSVTDSLSHPVTGLHAADFVITENGTPQAIRFFEEQKIEDGDLPLGHAGPEHIHIYDRLTPTQITPESPGQNQYAGHRLLAFYFDMTAMPPADQTRAIAAAEKFVRTQMTGADLIAILRYAGGAVNVLQDFTANRDRLLSILQTMTIPEGQGFDQSGSDATTPDAGAAFGQDDSEFNVFNSDRQLAALHTAANMLGELHEKKALLYFASGLRLNGLNNQAQLHATINAAIRAGVSFWPIDARGLVAEPPMGDATAASPGNAAMYTGESAQAVSDRFQLSQDTLYALASDTGGKALLDYNDLTKGIVNAQHAISTYYILGYYTTQTVRDGHFRRVRVKLNNSLSAKLDYRQGYFADKEFRKFTATDRERQLEDALMLPDPVTDLTIAMEVDYFQLNRAEYFVPLTVKIPGRELALAKRGGAEHTLIDFIGEIKDASGITVTNVRDKVNIKLTRQTAAELAKRPVEYEVGFTLLPGKYSLKFLARDDETGRIGTFQATFRVPNLNKEKKQVAISSVILSAKRTARADALYNISKKATTDNASPLMQDGQTLIPSVTRVFSKSRPLWLYAQAYEQGQQVQTLMALVTLFNGAAKIYESPATPASHVSNEELKTVPVNLQINLASVPPGRYDCQLTILNPADQKATFWRTSISVVP